jgi:LemA protein
MEVFISGFGLMAGFIIAMAILLFILVQAIQMFNAMIRLKNQVKNSLSTMDVLMKKRYDLIPNLVASVQEYAAHEKALMEELTALRTKAVSGQLTPAEKVEVDKDISKALGNIMVAVENYPDLKANQNFLQLQASLNEVEEQISAGRRAYNASVTDYNNALETIPTNIMGALMGLQHRPWYEIPEEQRDNVNGAALFQK